jgi:hypothetical protein
MSPFMSSIIGQCMERFDSDEEGHCAHTFPRIKWIPAFAGMTVSKITV